MFNFFKKKKSSDDDQNNIISLGADDAVIAAYKEKAQSELQYLIDFMNDNEKDEELFRYAIKARFVDGEEAEHMWVQVDEFKEGHFLGRLANEPHTVKSIKYGDNVAVQRTDVEDWILEDFLTHTNVGHFASAYIKGADNEEKN